MPRALRPIAALLAVACSFAADADAPFAFPIAWDDAAASVVDSSALVPAPLTGGPLRAIDGHLVDSTGKRVRLLAVNLVAGACFPDPSDAPAIAVRLRRLGVTCVRLHHMDAEWAKPNLFSLDGGFAEKPAPAMLARLDALIDQLARNGIRVDLNLHVARGYGVELGYPKVADMPHNGKAVGWFEERAQVLQRDFAKILLDRVNPLRGKRLADDPVLAMVELVNEDTLVGMAYALPELPDPWKGQILARWNAHLKKLHPTTADLLAAWNKGVRPAGADLVTDGRFASGLGAWVVERHAPAQAENGIEDPAGATDRPPGRVLRVTPQKLGGAPWNLQINRPGLTLAPGETYTLSFAARSAVARKLGVQVRLDHEPWTGLGLDESVKLDPGWKRFSFTFVAGPTAGPGCRISLPFGKEMGEFGLADFSLRPGGGGVALAAGQTVEAGTIPLVGVSASPAGREYAAFLIGIEEEFSQGMRTYIHDDLRCTAPVSCSQASYGGVAGLWRESRMDLVDMHSYWQHPSFPRRPWDMNDFRIENAPMVQATAGGALAGPAAYRVEGKPFTVSEYDHPAPSEYAAEGVPLAFATAARQDWDGVFLFDYLSTSAPAMKEPRLASFFSCAQHPAKLAFLPIAAEMFLAGGMPMAEGRRVLSLPAAGVADLASQQRGAFWSLAGAKDPLASLVDRRVSVRFADVAEPSIADLVQASAEQPMTWEGGDQAQVLLRAPRVAGAIGLIRGRRIEAGAIAITADASPRNFAAVALASRDGNPIAASRRLLLAAVDKAENSGLQWSDDRKAAKDAWKGEVRVTGVSGAIEMATDAKALHVWALDGRGARSAEVPCAIADGRLRFRMDVALKTVWYEIGAE